MANFNIPISFMKICFFQYFTSGIVIIIIIVCLLMVFGRVFHLVLSFFLVTNLQNIYGTYEIYTFL